MIESRWLRFTLGAEAQTPKARPFGAPVHGYCLEWLQDDAGSGDAAPGMRYGPAADGLHELIAVRPGRLGAAVPLGDLATAGDALEACARLLREQGLPDPFRVRPDRRVRDRLAEAIAHAADHPLTTLVIRGADEPAISSALRDALSTVPAQAQRGLYFSTVQTGPDPTLRIIGIPEELRDRAHVPTGASIIDLSESPREAVPGTPGTSARNASPGFTTCPACASAMVSRQPIHPAVTSRPRLVLTRSYWTGRRQLRVLRRLMPYRCADCDARFHHPGSATVLITGPPRCGATTLLDALEGHGTETGAFFRLGTSGDGRVREWAAGAHALRIAVETPVADTPALLGRLIDRGGTGTVVLCVDAAQLPGGGDRSEARPGFLREAVKALRDLRAQTDGSPAWTVQVVVTKADRLGPGADADGRPFLHASGPRPTVVGGLHRPVGISPRDLSQVAPIVDALWQ
jgi:hypothetical protein